MPVCPPAPLPRKATSVSLTLTAPKPVKFPVPPGIDVAVSATEGGPGIVAVVGALFAGGDAARRGKGLAGGDGAPAEGKAICREDGGNLWAVGGAVYRMVWEAEGDRRQKRSLPKARRWGRVVSRWKAGECTVLSLESPMFFGGGGASHFITRSSTWMHHTSLSPVVPTGRHRTHS